MGKIAITVTSSGLDRVHVTELVSGVVRRELEISLEAIAPENVHSAIGALVLGRIAMQEPGCISGDHIENAHKFAEAMAETVHPELLFNAYCSALARTSRNLDVKILDIAEGYLRASAEQNYPEAIEALEHWGKMKQGLIQYWKTQDRRGES